MPRPVQKQAIGYCTTCGLTLDGNRAGITKELFDQYATKHAEIEADMKHKAEMTRGGVPIDAHGLKVAGVCRIPLPSRPKLLQTKSCQNGFLEAMKFVIVTKTPFV